MPTLAERVAELDHILAGLRLLVESHQLGNFSHDAIISAENAASQFSALSLRLLLEAPGEGPINSADVSLESAAAALKTQQDILLPDALPPLDQDVRRPLDLDMTPGPFCGAALCLPNLPSSSFFFSFSDTRMHTHAYTHTHTHTHATPSLSRQSSMA